MINEKINDNKEHINFDDAFELTKREVDRVLSTSPSIIRTYTEHLAKTKGKFIRAMSLIACAEDKEGFIHPDAIKFAAAIEILHLATLVHDDIIDNANKRRGIVTLQKKYGKRTAVICGDYLLSVALKTAASVSNRENYTKFDAPDYISRICLGELTQHINNSNLDLSVYQYLKIISGKTAALFEASFYGGAIFSEKDTSIFHKYRSLGRYIGMIFQLTDDCMDFEISEEVAKKPVKSDFEQGVITLPLIHTLNRSTAIKEKAKTGKVTRHEIDGAVRASDGLGFTRMVSMKYYNKALKIINELEMTENKRIRLTSILNKAFRGLSK